MALWNFFSKKKSPQDMLIAGDLDGALKGFKRQLKAKDNKDPLLMLKIGGIYQQKGEPVRARMYYMAVGEYYGDQGFLNKAVAAYKKALDITPNDKGILDKLASYNNQVPKYMINSDILQRIRTANEEDATPEVEVAPQPPSPGGHYEEIDGTFRFPEMEDEEEKSSTAPSVSESPATFDPTDPSWEEQHAPEPSPPEENPFSGGIFGQYTVGEEEPDGDPYAQFSLPSKTPEPDQGDPQGAKPSEQKAPPAAKDPFHLADPDFDPDASLRLEEDEEEEEVIPVYTELAERMNLPKNPTLAHPAPTEPPTSPSVEKVAPSAPPKRQLPTNEDVTTATRVSDDDKMVFSSRAAAKPQAQANAQFKRSFSTLDDALEDLFSVGPDEDKAVRKEQDQRHFPLFRTMSTKVFVDFVMALENQEFDTGALIVKQGSPGHHMFIIVEGAVDVILTTGTFTSTVACLETGDFFGEAALLSGKPRTASIVAKKPTTCLVLSRQQLKELAVNHPSVLETIRSVYYARMVENESHGE